MEHYRNPVNGRVHGADTWCSQCEQAHPTENWERAGWFCPARCGGSGLDALPWSFVKQRHPDYPERPQPGRHYLWRTSTPAKQPAHGSMRGWRELVETH